MNNELLKTICDAKWVVENKDKILNILPETWTHVQNINPLQISFQMKLLGIDWQSEEEFGRVMVFLEKIKLLERDGLLIRRGRNTIF